MSPTSPRAHLVLGGFPAGSSAGHDMEYARRRILGALAATPALTTVSQDYTDLERWLGESRFLLSYVAGPFPDPAQTAAIQDWIEGGGRWLALHGTSGGKAARLDAGGRAMVRMPHHELLGGFFLNHPPLRQFRVDVNPGHPLTEGLPESFDVSDELYLIELREPKSHQVLLTTDLPEDPSPRGFGFHYERDTALQPDGKTRVLGYVRELGKGAVAYVALGHCHDASSNIQPFVDKSVAADGSTPTTFRGSWETDGFARLLDNAVNWGLSEQSD